MEPVPGDRNTGGKLAWDTIPRTLIADSPPAGPPSLPAPQVSTYRQVAGLCIPPLRAAEDHISQERGVWFWGSTHWAPRAWSPDSSELGHPAGVQGAPSPARWVLKVKLSLFTLHLFQGLVTSEEVETAVWFALAA